MRRPFRHVEDPTVSVAALVVLTLLAIVVSLGWMLALALGL